MIQLNILLLLVARPRVKFDTSGKLRSPAVFTESIIFNFSHHISTVRCIELTVLFYTNYSTLPRIKVLHIN